MVQPQSLILNLSRLFFQRSEAAAAHAMSLGVTKIETTMDSDEIVADLVRTSAERVKVYLKVGYREDGKNMLGEGDYVSESINGSKIVSAARENSNIRVVGVAHNIEEVKSRASWEGALRQFDAMVSKGELSSFGVASNGISLDKAHPLSVSINDLLDSCKNLDHELACVMLPFNCLENRGLMEIPSERGFETIGTR